MAAAGRKRAEAPQIEKSGVSTVVGGGVAPLLEEGRGDGIILRFLIRLEGAYVHMSHGAFLRTLEFVRASFAMIFFSYRV